MDNIDHYEINIERVIENASTHSIIRLLAVDVKKNPYLTIGDWLQSLSDKDCQSLIDDLVEAEEEDNFAMESLILGALILSRAEQVFIETDEQMSKAIGMLRMFIVISSLHRKKMAKAIYKNMSFGEDAAQLSVAEKL